MEIIIFEFTLNVEFGIPPYYQLWPTLLQRTRLAYFPKKCDVATISWSIIDWSWFHDLSTINLKRYNADILIVTMYTKELLWSRKFIWRIWRGIYATLSSYIKLSSFEGTVNFALYFLIPKAVDLKSIFCDKWSKAFDLALIVESY